MREDPETHALRLAERGVAAPQSLGARHRSGIENVSGRALAFALLLAFFAALFIGLEVGPLAGALTLAAVLGSAVLWTFHRRHRLERKRDAQVAARAAGDSAEP